jgi:hypothetical protein
MDYDHGFANVLFTLVPESDPWAMIDEGPTGDAATVSEVISLRRDVWLLCKWEPCWGMVGGGTILRLQWI